MICKMMAVTELVTTECRGSFFWDTLWATAYIVSSHEIQYETGAQSLVVLSLVQSADVNSKKPRLNGREETLVHVSSWIIRSGIYASVTQTSNKWRNGITSFSHGLDDTQTAPRTCPVAPAGRRFPFAIQCTCRPTIGLNDKSASTARLEAGYF